MGFAMFEGSHEFFGHSGWPELLKSKDLKVIRIVGSA